MSSRANECEMKKRQDELKKNQNEVKDDMKNDVGEMNKKSGRGETGPLQNEKHVRTKVKNFMQGRISKWNDLGNGWLFANKSVLGPAIAIQQLPVGNTSR